MPLSNNTSCLYSTLKNTSGGTKKFGFLPPHGRELAVNEEVVVFGDIREAVGRGDRATDQRHRAALERSLDNGDIEITKTPNPIMRDTATGLAKMIVTTSGSLALADVCWNTSLGAGESIT